MDDEIKFIIVMFLIIIVFAFLIALFLQGTYLYDKFILGDPQCFWVKCIKAV